MRPGAGAPPLSGGPGEGEPLGWTGPGMSSLPQVRSEWSGWPRGTRHSSPAAHCILAPRGRRGLALGRLGQGSAGLRGQDARSVCSRDCRYLIASLRGCPTPLRGSRRSAARPLWSYAKWPACPPHIIAVRGGRSPVNIGRREPFAARTGEEHQRESIGLRRRTHFWPLKGTRLQALEEAKEDWSN